MVIYVLDASAVLRYLDDEAGVDRMKEILVSRHHAGNRLLMSAIQWGEVAAAFHRRNQAGWVPRVLGDLLKVGVEAVAVTKDQAVRAAALQHTARIPYADAFLVTLAQESPESILVTADFDFKLVDRLVAVEFLPPKNEP